MANKKRSFAQFRAEAQKAEPYVIEKADGGEIAIDALTTGQLFELADNATSPRETLRIICGDNFEELYAEVKNLPIEAFNEFFSDLMEHFGMGGAPSQSGGN